MSARGKGVLHTKQNGSANGALTPADTPRLSSIYDIRHKNHKEQYQHQQPGFHPPVPPKPTSAMLEERRSSQSPPTIKARPGGAGSAGIVVSAGRSYDDDLIRELIFTFQGIEGTMLRGRNGDFHFHDSYAKKYPPSVVQLALRLAEIGWLYSQVNSFCENMAEDRDSGLIGQSLVTALKNELSEYYRLLSTLESQLRETDSGLSLHHLSVWMVEPTNRLKLLVSIVNAVKEGRKRGGALISTVYSFLHHGDPTASQTVHSLLCTVCKPMYVMLLRWICDGTLEDPFNEFFIASDPKVTSDRLWHDKYSIRHSMIPKFMSLSWAKKILATGKSINFLHEVCRDTSAISGRDFVKENIERTTVESFFSDPAGSDSLFHQTLDRAFKDTSAHVLSVLFSKYKFLDHISAMRKYLLLGQGDIIRCLLELLEEELCQPASNLYPHNLAGILETAIRATNTRFEDPEILDRLDVRLLEIQPGDTGWDVFSLDYKVAGPIGTVFGERTMTHYLMLFNALWRAKRLEWLLSGVWKNLASMHKMQSRIVPELAPLLHIANLLASEMIHFIHQLAYYITFEVMECSWDILIKQLRQAESLDQVIEAHEEFLQTLLKRALLDDESRELLMQLRAIYDRILEFQGIQSRLYAAASTEAEARMEEAETLRRRGRAGHYGITAEEEESMKRRKRAFTRTTLSAIKSQLKIVSQSYQDMVRTFLLQLAESGDQALQFLSFRLDFNQHYKRQDARLHTPLTFQHSRMRESMQGSISSTHIQL